MSVAGVDSAGRGCGVGGESPSVFVALKKGEEVVPKEAKAPNPALIDRKSVV